MGAWGEGLLENDTAGDLEVFWNNFVAAGRYHISIPSNATSGALPRAFELTARRGNAAFCGRHTPMFVRFVVSERDPDSGHDRGIFTALYDLEKRGELLAHELTWFRDAETWLNTHLAPPSRLSRSTRPGTPDVAISWLKLSAVEHLRRMRDLVQLLEHKGIPVSELRTERPGYVVYEDDHQVAAIPFSRETF